MLHNYKEKGSNIQKLYRLLEDLGEYIYINMYIYKGGGGNIKMYLSETDWEGVHWFASEKGQLVGFCESGDEISFSANAGNYLTSLGTNVFAL